MVLRRVFFVVVIAFFFFLMHTSHYHKLTTQVNRYARAATLQIPFCAFCLPGHPDASFMTALEAVSHALLSCTYITPSNADRHSYPGESSSLPPPASFLFSPQQVFFPGRQESHVDRSHCIPEGMSDASACRCRPRIPTEPFENEIQEVAACNLPQRASVDMEV